MVDYTYKSLMEELTMMAKELKAYKDTGLTPEQIYEMDKLYAEKCREVAKSELPCKIGDEVWAVRHYLGTVRAYKGVVSEMYYTPDMELIVVVKNILRGKIGEKVFLTEEEAEKEVEKETSK